MLKLFRGFEARMLGGQYLAGLDVLARGRQVLILYLLLMGLLLSFIVTARALAAGEPINWLRLALFEFGLVMTYLFLVKTRDIARISYFLLLTSTAFLVLNACCIVGEINLAMVQLAMVNTLFAFFMAGQRLGLLAAVFNFLPLLFLRQFELNNYFAQYFDLNQLSKSEQMINWMVMTVIMVYIIWHFQRAFKRYAVELEHSLAAQEELNLALEQARMEAEASSRAKSNFLSVMSHEIRTPMNGIIGITELLQEQTRDKKQREYLDLLKFSADNLLGMLNNVLDYNRLDSGRTELEKLVFNPTYLFKQLVAGFQPMADDKRIKLILEADQLPERVLGDPTKLSQILINLLGNAIKFTNEGEVKLQLTALGNDRYRVAIKDTGVGIAEDKQVLIFEHFSQASADVSRKYGGSGLGLAIVKKLLLLMESDIQLQSRQGEGSVFSFELELMAVQESESMLRGAENNPSSIVEGTRVLVVEDNPINATVINGLLKRWKLQYIWVSGGKDALHLLNQEHFDLILMDLHMPEMDGFETIQAIRSLGLKLPIIAISADVQEETLKKAHAVGANDYIVKPYNPRDLHQVIENCLQIVS